MQNLPNVFPANTYKDTETTEDLPLDPPKFSSPFASTVAIRQNFTPPKFSRVRYSMYINVNVVPILFRGLLFLLSNCDFEPTPTSTCSSCNVATNLSICVNKFKCNIEEMKMCEHLLFHPS